MSLIPLPTERHVQRSILRMLGSCFREAFVLHIPNGAHLSGNARQRGMQMGALKGDGLKNGTPDLLILWEPGEGAFIEVKRPKVGRLTPDQVAVHARLTELEWPVATVDNIDDAYRFLIECGAPCSARLAA